MIELLAISFWLALRKVLFSSRIYDWLLSKKVDEDLKASIPQTWPGNPDEAKVFLGENLNLQSNFWTTIDNKNPNINIYNQFSFLSDLHAVGTDLAREKAQSLIISWISENSKWNQVSWRSDILGERISNWITFKDYILTDLDLESKNIFFNSLYQQIKHLKIVVHTFVPNDQIFSALKGLLYYSLICRTPEHTHKNVLTFIHKSIKKQLLPDGGHISRNPSIIYSLLKLFIEIKELLINKNIEVPKYLQDSIDKMVPIIRCLQLGDGRLALFNGSTEENNEIINLVLLKCNMKTKALNNAMYTGYQRLSTKRTIIIVETGKVPPFPFDKYAHSAPLSFELSINKQRIIVNCGSFKDNTSGWDNLLRSTAAHSSLSINNSDAIELNSHGQFFNKDLNVAFSRQESNGNVWFESEHDGFKKRFNIIHKRQIYLSSTGDDIRGSDEILGSGPGNFTIRFHFHPSIQATLVQNQSEILMRLQNGTGLRFRVNGGQLLLEDSIYLGNGLKARRSYQAVISGNIGHNGSLVKWKLDTVKS